MREALLIFRKDVHHLWPRVIPVLAVTALMGWLECLLFVINPIYESLRGVWLLAATYLVASLIQQETLPGHQQYWLTRPFHRGHLFLAKALFLAVFAGLPILVMEVVSLSVNGVSPWRHIPLLLAVSWILAGAACTVAAALAAVTENLVQMLWGFLPSVGALILGLVLASNNDHAGDWQWDSLEWIRSSAMGLAVLSASAAVLYLQYSRRKTTLSRCLLGGAILAAGVGPSVGSWHAAWVAGSKFSKQQLDGSAAQLIFDPAVRPALTFADTTYSPKSGEAGINLPIKVTGIPAGTALVSERVTARIEAPGGRSWTSTWTRTGGVYRTTPLEDPHLIPGDGPYWVYVNVDDEFYRTVKEMPVHLHTAVALTLLGERRTVPLATRDSNEAVSDEGLCRAGPGPFAKLMVTCAWLGHTPARAYVTAVSIRTGQTSAGLITAGSGSPYPLSGSIWARDAALFTPPPATHEMDLETWQAVAHFDRELDLPQVRLADYAVRRITDMP
jgi:hypothetical protein